MNVVRRHRAKASGGKTARSAEEAAAGTAGLL
jgi:hypothetical protein